MFRESTHFAAVYANLDMSMEITLRSTISTPKRISARIVAAMLRHNVAVIVTGGTPPAIAAKKATSTVPIIVAVSGDIVGDGLAANLAHPGANVTGLTSVASDLSGKRLELIKDHTAKSLARRGSR
jgi:putative ABC transport system substrate-binding protein